MEIDAGARGLPGENAICTGGDGAWRLIRVRTRAAGENAVCTGGDGVWRLMRAHLRLLGKCDIRWRKRRVGTDAGAVWPAGNTIYISGWYAETVRKVRSGKT